MLSEALQNLSMSNLTFTVGALLLAFAFEFVNGFHDTANAVATVIYTKSLKPTTAVIWSALWNVIGIFAGGIGVAYAIVHLLPVEILIGAQSKAGIVMIVSLLASAIVWNLGTWYFGLPASSSHALIGSILGIGVGNALMQGKPLLSGINLHKLSEVSLSLLLSPLLGYALAAALLLLSKKWFPDPALHRPPTPSSTPSGVVRGLLVTTCTGVSFAHGSNDGQKGMGLVMLILIGMMPMEFALNRDTSLLRVADSLHEVRSVVSPTGTKPVSPTRWNAISPEFDAVEGLLAGRNSVAQLPPESRWAVRVELLKIQSWLSTVRKFPEYKANPTLLKAKKGIADSVEYVPFWVILCVALSLGLGTTVGWQRIVVTVGEKIGKSHLTYSQGAAAELVAMGTIGIASFSGLPVSTTHVLSSGVAGTMWANRSGLNFSTVKQIAAAWVLTLPATMILACGLFALGQTLFA